MLASYSTQNLLMLITMLMNSQKNENQGKNHKRMILNNMRSLNQDHLNVKV